MMGGLLKSASRLAIVAAAGLAAGSVATQAADLGGNCCADLEERVAELEATAARKGTRRMGLQIYGQISEAVLHWDDGGERNTYVVEQNGEQNRFGVQGSAKIDQTWSAGFKMEWQLRAFRSSSADQFARGDNEGLTHTTFNTQSLALKHAYWYLRSTTLGTLSVGQQSDSASGVLSINLAEPDGFSATDAGYAIRDFFVRVKGQPPGNDGLSDKNWRQVGFAPRNGDGPNSFDYTRSSSIRYTTPNLMGFTASASWGEDDYWSAALRYAGEMGPFRLAAGIAYSDWRDLGRHGCSVTSAGNEGSATVSAVNCQSLTTGASVMHRPTGLYVSGGWAQLTDDNRRTVANSAGITGPIDDTDSYWWVQVGWEAKLNALGNTTFWTDYMEWDGGLRVSGHVLDTVAGADPLNSFATTSRILSTSANSWGLGVTQEIDAAEMNLYAGFRNFSTDVTLINNNVVRKSNGVEDMQILYSGATVKF